MRIVQFLLFAMFISVLFACNDHAGRDQQSSLALDSLDKNAADSISDESSANDMDVVAAYDTSARAFGKGNLADEWKNYFKACLQSEIDSKVSYVSMANIDGPGILYNQRLGIAGKNIKNYVPPSVYASLIDSSGSASCTLSENDYKLIGGFFKATILKLINVNPEAQGTKLDTIIFNMDHYSRTAINKGVLDSLYETKDQNQMIKKYFDEFSKKSARMIIKGYVISGFNATIKFKQLDTVGIVAGLDSGVVKNFSGNLGFKLNKSRNKEITASATSDFIPLVQFVKMKDLD